MFYGNITNKTYFIARLHEYVDCILVNVLNIHDSVKLSALFQSETTPQLLKNKLKEKPWLDRRSAEPNSPAVLWPGDKQFFEVVIPFIVGSEIDTTLTIIGKSGDVVRPGFTWSLNPNNDLSVLSKEAGLNYPVFAPDRSKKNAFKNPTSPLIKYNQHPIYKDALHPIYELSALWNEVDA